MPLTWGRRFRKQSREPSRSQQVEQLVDQLSTLVDRLNRATGPVIDEPRDTRKDGRNDRS